MNFAQYRRTLKLELIDTLFIDYDLIHCQYNPDLCEHWIKVCGDSMKIDSTPYYHYLETGNTDKYEQLMRLYGRSDTWTINNIYKFAKLFGDISVNGVKEFPIVLNEPIKKNPYNSKLEIWEGHRRLSISKYLKLKTGVQLCRIV